MAKSIGTIRVWGVALLGLGLLLAEPAAAQELRWRWSNPLPHGGNVFDMTFGLGLAVQVTERGQIFTSEDLLFWQPRETPTTNSLRAVTFFGNRLIVTGEKGTVLYADSLEDIRLVDLGTSDWIESVTASSNLLVAVGDNAAIYTSTTGTNWQRHTPPFTNWLRCVTHHPLLNLFVTVGEGGRIATSPNGSNWTIRASGTTRHLNYVAPHTDGFWVLGEGGLVLTSPLGVNWTVVNTGATNALYGFAANADSRLVVGDREVRRRVESTWFDELTATNGFPAPEWTYHRALWLGTFYFLAGRSGMMVEGFQTNSTGSYLWVTRRPSVRNWLWEVQRLPEFYVTVGYRGTVMTSSDGIDWSLEWVPDSVTNTVLLGVGGNTNLLLAVGDKGAILTSPQQWVSVVLTNADGTLITNQVSTLGVVWYDQPRPVTNDLQGVAVFGNQYVLSGSNGRILTSTNGTNWIVRATPVNTFLSGLTAFPGGLVAVGQGGVILTSPDAISWTNRASGTTNWIYRVRYLQNQLIAVGQNGTILTSPDGVSWTARPGGTTRWLNDVTWLAGWYYVVGTQGAVLRSTNAVHWQFIGTVTEKSLYGIARADGKLVAVGVEGAIVRSPVVPDLTPIRFLRYARLETNNLFLVAGKPDQRFRLDHSTFFTNWNAGPTLEFLDSSGTLLFLENTGTNAPAAEFYRGELRP